MANYIQPSSYHLSPNELEQLLAKEKEKNRLQRIRQVREQSKHIASDIRNRVTYEKENQLKLTREHIQLRLQAEREEQINEVENLIEKCCREIGSSHRFAREKNETLAAHKRAVKKISAKTDRRGKLAINKMHNEKSAKDKENIENLRARSTLIQVEKERAAKIAGLPLKANIEADKSEQLKHVRKLNDDVHVEKHAPSIKDDNAHDLAMKKIERDQHIIKEKEMLKQQQIDKAEERFKEAIKKKKCTIKPNNGTRKPRDGTDKVEDKKFEEVIPQLIPVNGDSTVPSLLDIDKLRMDFREIKKPFKRIDSAKNKYKRVEVPPEETLVEDSDFNELIDQIKKQRNYWIHRKKNLQARNSPISVPRRFFSAPTYHELCERGLKILNSPDEKKVVIDDNDIKIPSIGERYPEKGTSTGMASVSISNNSSRIGDSPLSIQLSDIDSRNVDHKMKINAVKDYHKQLLGRSKLGQEILERNGEIISSTENSRQYFPTVQEVVNAQKLKFRSEILTSPESNATSDSGNVLKALMSNDRIAKDILKQTAEKLEKEGLIKKTPPSQPFLALSDSMVSIDSPPYLNGIKTRPIQASDSFAAEQSRSTPSMFPSLNLSELSSVTNDSTLIDFSDDQFKSAVDQISTQHFNVLKRLDELQKFKERLQDLTLSCDEPHNVISEDDENESSQPDDDITIQQSMYFHPHQLSTIQEVLTPDASLVGVSQPTVDTLLDLMPVVDENSFKDLEPSASISSPHVISDNITGHNSESPWTSSESNNWKLLEAAATNASPSLHFQPLHAEFISDNSIQEYLDSIMTTPSWGSSNISLPSGSVNTTNIMSGFPSETHLTGYGNFDVFTPTSNGSDFDEDNAIPDQELEPTNQAITRQTFYRDVHTPPRSRVPVQNLALRSQSTPIKKRDPRLEMLLDVEHGITDEPDLTFADSQVSSVCSSAVSTPHKRNKDLFTTPEDLMVAVPGRSSSNVPGIEQQRFSMASSSSLSNSISNFTLQSSDYMSVAEHPLSPSPSVQNLSVTSARNSASMSSGSSGNVIENTQESVLTVINVGDRNKRRVESGVLSESLLSFQRHELSADDSRLDDRENGESQPKDVGMSTLDDEDHKLRTRRLWNI